MIGVDVHIRPHNRSALEAHPLVDRIALVEGSSIDLDVVAQIRAHDQTRRPRAGGAGFEPHQRARAGELEAYAPLVTPGSYIVAMDGIMADVAGALQDRPRLDVEQSAKAAAELR